MLNRILAPLVLLFATAASGGDWPNWRGPSFDGALDGSPLAARETFALELDWKRALGSGYSAVVVAGDSAVTMFSDHSDDFVISLDVATGDERWRHRLAPTYRGHDGSEDGPSGTPTIAGDRVIALAPGGLLVALDLASGRLLWSVDVVERFAAREPRFGFTAPPLALGETTMISVGGADGKTFVALDVATGELRWSAGDDNVSYESSILATLGGRSQIVAISNHRLTALDPERGDLLWSFEYHPGEAFGTSQIFALGDDRLVVQDGRETVLYRFVGSDAEPPLEALWRTGALGSGLSVPVAHEEHLYGFAGNFLTAVRLADGEKVWKSRPPGGTGLIVADGHLITLGNDGDLVVARANPERFDEAARLNVFDDPGVTYPTFAAGRIFVRNTDEIAAVRIVDRPQQPPPAAPAPADDFERFVRDAASAADPRAAVRDYMRGQTSVPIVIGHRAHFVYWGPAEDVAIDGTPTGRRGEEQLARIPGTDFFHRSYELSPDARAEYWFNVDFEHRQPDPLNPRRRAFPDWWYEFEISELSMPGYRAPLWATDDAPTARGSVEIFSWSSPSLGNTRTIGVYLPHGYAEGDALYPLSVFLHGDLWRTRGGLPELLDRAIAAGALPPTLAVFVGRAEGLTWQEMSGEAPRLDFERALAEEILPVIAERYHVADSPGSRAIVGLQSGTRPALEMLLDRPDLFGHAVLIASEWSAGVDRELLEHAARLPPGARASLSVHWSRALSGGELPEGDREFLGGLRGLGYATSETLVRDASGWWSWALQALDRLLLVFADSR